MNELLQCPSCGRSEGQTQRSLGGVADPAHGPGAQNDVSRRGVGRGLGNGGWGWGVQFRFTRSRRGGAGGVGGACTDAPPRPCAARDQQVPIRAEVTGRRSGVRAKRLRRAGPERSPKTANGETPTRPAPRRPGRPAWRRSAGCSPSKATSSAVTWATGRPRSRCRYAYVTRGGPALGRAGPWPGGCSPPA